MRLVVEEAFQELGYKVVVAEDAKKALALLDANPGVNLLFTDVVMPEMSGRELVKEALSRRPDLKVVYTTGFSRNAMIHNGVIDPDVNFLAEAVHRGKSCAEGQVRARRKLTSLTFA